jgi:hypothetical protein
MPRRRWAQGERSTARSSSSYRHAHLGPLECTAWRSCVAGVLLVTSNRLEPSRSPGAIGCGARCGSAGRISAPGSGVVLDGCQSQSSAAPVTSYARAAATALRSREAVCIFRRHDLPRGLAVPTVVSLTGGGLGTDRPCRRQRYRPGAPRARGSWSSCSPRRLARRRPMSTKPSSPAGCFARSASVCLLQQPDAARHSIEHRGTYIWCDRAEVVMPFVPHQRREARRRVKRERHNQSTAPSRPTSAPPFPM